VPPEGDLGIFMALAKPHSPAFARPRAAIGITRPPTIDIAWRVSSSVTSFASLLRASNINSTILGVVPGEMIVGTISPLVPRKNV
jgi:hypothetical protein